MEYGRPVLEDPAVVEELRREKLIQPQAPLAWRDAELKYLRQALGLETRVTAFPIPQASAPPAAP